MGSTGGHCRHHDIWVLQASQYLGTAGIMIFGYCRNHGVWALQGSRCLGTAGIMIFGYLGTAGIMIFRYYRHHDIWVLQASRYSVGYCRHHDIWVLQASLYSGTAGITIFGYCRHHDIRVPVLRGERAARTLGVRGRRLQPVRLRLLLPVHGVDGRTGRHLHLQIHHPL